VEEYKPFSKFTSITKPQSVQNMAACITNHNETIINIYLHGVSLFERVILAQLLKKLLYFAIKSLVANTGTVQV